MVSLHILQKAASLLTAVNAPSSKYSEFTQYDGRKKRTAKRFCVTNVTGLLLACFSVIFTLRLCFLALRRMRFGEKLFQTKLLSRLSCRACRLLSSRVLLRKFTEIFLACELDSRRFSSFIAVEREETSAVRRLLSFHSYKMWLLAILGS